MNKSITRLRIFEKKLAKSGILNFTNNLPKSAEVYLVGGIVRDIITNRKNPGDIDLVVRNVEINVLEKILKKHGKVNFVGKSFGVFKFQPKKTKSSNNKQSAINNQQFVDIALPRTEHSFGTGAYKDFKINYNHKLPIKKDLSRRDFTINAIAYQLSPKNSSSIKHQASSIQDPFHGLRDLQNKIIKTVGKPTRRFKEDYSRMLRAIRIACELNFEIEKKTLSAIKKQMSHINDSVNPRSVNPRIYSGVSNTKRHHHAHQFIGERQKRLVPYEIIASEILKSFQANPVRALDILDKTGALRELIPELLFMKNCPQGKKHHSEGDVWTHARLALSFINSPKYRKKFPFKKPPINNQQSTINNQSIELILAVLFHDIGKPATIKIQNNKISFHNHAKVGAKIAKNICQRLKFSAAPGFDINCQNIYHLVAKHMLHLYGRVSKLRNSTIVKYFLLDSKLGDKLQKLFWLDSMASIPKLGKPDLSDLTKLRKRINSIKKHLKVTQKKPILTGYDIIKEFKLKPGPKIGKLLAILRETQLSGLVKNKKEAIKLLKREIK